MDVALRVRTAGYSDATHADTLPFRQLSLRAVQPLGDWRVTLLGDDRLSVDPRSLFSEEPFAARTLGVGLAYERRDWGVGLQVRDAWMRAREVPGEGEPLEGGRSSVGLEGH